MSASPTTRLSSGEPDRITRWADEGITIHREHPEHGSSREVSVRESRLQGQPINIAVEGWNGDQHLATGENLTIDQAAEVIRALARLIARNAHA